MNDGQDEKSMKKLNNFLFANRITPNSITGKTSSELFLGRMIKSRLDNLKTELLTKHIYGKFSNEKQKSEGKVWRRGTD